MKRIVPLLAALALLAAACSDSDEPADADATGVSGSATTTTLDPGLSFAGTVAAPEFPEGLDWLNTSEPLTLAGLRGKVVLLDFWTYGCINCIHIIPDLKRLEAEYPNELVVIGVHSAKFVNESETENIRNVILRYAVEHPVVNDRDFLVWNTWGANAWPTTVLIDPAGNVVGGHSGEGVYEVMQPVVAGLVGEFQANGGLDPTPISFDLEVDGRPDTILSFPGKVFTDGEILYVADTGHHRIVAADAGTGDVIQVYGRGSPGFADGAALEAEFDSPQGMALSPDGARLYVADTNNHAIRAIDLARGSVSTVLGTGEQGWPPTGGIGTDVSLASPWALEQRNGLLYIAMAGHHQIWFMDLATGAAAPLVGNSRESTLNGPLSEAELAQPSGLAFDNAGVLYFADSESSAIRSAEVELGDSGTTNILVGSDDNLFDFGDIDGVGTDARLQHPLGLALADDGFLYVADTYNSKIKRIDVGARSIETFVGGEQGWEDGTDPRFYEPGGLAAHGNRLFVADTNNHAVRIIDLVTGQTSTLVLNGIEAFAPPADDSGYRGEIIDTGTLEVAPGSGFVELAITLPTGHKVNDQAPSSAEFIVTGAVGVDQAIVQLTGAEFPVRIPVEFTGGPGSMIVDLTVIYCHEETESLCLIQQLRFLAEVTTRDGAPNSVQLEHTIALPDL